MTSNSSPSINANDVVAVQDTSGFCPTRRGSAADRGRVLADDFVDSATIPTWAMMAGPVRASMTRMTSRFRRATAISTWSYNQGASGGDTGAKMMPGTSPSIDDHDDIAFQGSNGDLWIWIAPATGVASGAHDLGLGMKAGTSPSISLHPGGLGGARPQTSQIGGPRQRPAQRRLPQRPHLRRPGQRPHPRRRGQRPALRRAGQRPHLRRPGQRPDLRRAGKRPHLRRPRPGPHLRRDRQRPDRRPPRRHDRVPGTGNQPGRRRRSPRRRSGGVRARFD